jgi:hypothetical protein
MIEGDWVSAEKAVERLTNHSDDPRALLLSLLREGSVAARAESVWRDGEARKWAPFLKRHSHEIKARFWEIVSDKDWSAGIFGFTEAAPSEQFGLGETFHWRAVGVELNWLQVLQQVGTLPIISQKTRAPSMKSGRPPSDDLILAKADEMKARGLDGRKIAAQMRLEVGFEDVSTIAVRELIKGRWERGRPKKTA